MKKRKRLGDSAACPRIVVTPRPRDGAVDFTVDGNLARMTIIQDAGAYRVGWISVRDDANKRCKLGTRLYEAAVRYACDEGLKLRSDTLRSASSQGFWEKQVVKGRAICESETRPPPSNTSPDIPAEGRGGCLTYRIKNCAVTDLSGRKRR